MGHACYMLSFTLFWQMARVAHLLNVTPKVCFLSSPFRFPLFLSSGWNGTLPLIISQTPPSLSLLVFLLPPSCAESSAVNVNPGLSCPAVCIPSLLGEHGKAPGPLCSHRREVNGKRKRGERESEGERHSARVELLVRSVPEF